MSRSNKILLAALTVSLLLNFAAAGYVGVRLIRDHVYHSLVDNTAVVESLPAELKQTFREAIRSDRVGMLKALGALRSARDRQHEVLTAEKLDNTALEQAQSEVRGATDQLIVHLQRALRVAASDLPDDVRRSIPKIRIGRDLLKNLERSTE